MKNRNMIFDFTQCYPKRKEPGLEWHDCSAIGGSRLYCSRDAEEKIKESGHEVVNPAEIDGEGMTREELLKLDLWMME